MTDGDEKTTGPAPAAADAPAEAAPAPVPSTGGWTRAILIGSLVLNLVLLGAIAGAGISHRAMPDRRQTGDAGLGLLYEALPRQEQRALRREVIPDLRDRAALRREIVADTRALLVAVRAEPFDRAAVAAALGRQRARATGFLDAGSTRMLDLLSEMPAVDRQAYADRLEQAIRRRAGDRD